MYKKISLPLRGVLLIGLGIFLIFFGEGYFSIAVHWLILFGLVGLALGAHRLYLGLKMWNVFLIILPAFIISCHQDSPSNTQIPLLVAQDAWPFTAEVLKVYNQKFPSDTIAGVVLSNAQLITAFTDDNVEATVRFCALTFDERQFLESRNISSQQYALGSINTNDTLYFILKGHHRAQAYRFAEFCTSSTGQKVLSKVDGFQVLYPIWREVKTASIL